jgi:PIN domain nuclease of toxin-antitoxin system
VLALILRETGWERVRDALDDAMLSTVTYSEAVARLTERGASEDIIHDHFRALDVPLVEFDASIAFSAGRLRRPTRAHGLTFADRACLATARHLGLPVLTADQAWAGLDIGVRVELIR